MLQKMAEMVEATHQMLRSCQHTVAFGFCALSDCSTLKLTVLDGRYGWKMRQESK